MRAPVVGGWYIWKKEEYVRLGTQDCDASNVGEQESEQHSQEGVNEGRSSVVVRGVVGKIRSHRPRPLVGLTRTSTTPTPQARSDCSEGEDTRSRRGGFRPGEGIR